jgi:hypothetical protein
VAWFGLFTVCDLALTTLVLGKGGGEFNPIMRWAFDSGIWTAAAVKLLPLCCALGLWALSGRVVLAGRGLRALTVTMGGVVVYSVVGLCATS